MWRRWLVHQYFNGVIQCVIQWGPPGLWVDCSDCSLQCCALQSCSTKTSTKMAFKMNDRVLISNMSQAMRQTGNWECKAGDCVINFLSAQDTHKLDTTVLLTVLIFFSVVTAFCFLINFNEHFNKCSIYSHQYFFLSAWMCFSVGLFP